MLTSGGFYARGYFITCNMSTEENKAETEQIKLKRVLSKWETSAYIICVVIGSGIFVSPKPVLEYGGSPAAALAIWTFTGCEYGAKTNPEPLIKPLYIFRIHCPAQRTDLHRVGVDISRERLRLCLHQGRLWSLCSVSLQLGIHLLRECGQGSGGHYLQQILMLGHLPKLFST